MTQVSLVMATYEGGEHLREQLASIAAQRTPRDWELVIADNGSSDNTIGIAEEAAQADPRVRLIDASDRRGQSHARNRGAAAARGQYLLFVDQDDRLRPSYVEAMSAALDRHAAVAARMDLDALNSSWHRGARTPAQVHSLGDGLGFLPYAAGCTIGVRAEPFWKVGGFDTEMIGAAEDVDLCWRLQLQAATDLHFVGGAVMEYRLRSSTSALAKQAYGHGRAQAQLYERYGPVGMPGPSLRGEALRHGAAMKRWLRSPSRHNLASIEWHAVHAAGYLPASTLLSLRRRRSVRKAMVTATLEDRDR